MYVNLFSCVFIRLNSSILGQKKKNQRKARNKKRAQERRHSESETSEVEEKKERDLKTSGGITEQQDEENDEVNDEDYVKEENDIFHFDMDH